ncbi:MAG: DUF1565 domain-containing protein [Candidatus Hydrogenedentes bacterium]|nr:DUF1565 domain-containing protein [Candidatus Hydrogenedentota bacterium]
MSQSWIVVTGVLCRRGVRADERKWGLCVLALSYLLSLNAWSVGDLTWTKVLGQFEGRANHASVVHDGKLWILGGSSFLGPTNDVWSSADGANWTQVTASAPWTARSSHAAVAFGGKIYLFGGSNSYTGEKIGYNDVWSSADGINWTQVTASAPWAARDSRAAAVFAGKIWILGGNSDLGGNLNDIWSSADGSNWTQDTTAAPWSARRGHAAVVHDNKLWIIGGDSNGQSLTDVWSSPDGANWTQVTDAVPWTGRYSHTSLSLNGQLWLMGGFIGGDSMQMSSEIWSSPDGLNWTQVLIRAPWAPRAWHTGAIFDSKLWVIGGGGGILAFNDAWSSPDGTNWTQTVATPPWGPRLGHSTSAHNNRLWVLGGIGGDFDGGGQAPADVWSSSDGGNWQQDTAAAPWTARYFHSSAAFDGKLWILGGAPASGGGTTVLDDIWFSSDGVAWSPISVATPWLARGFHYSLVHDGKLWVIGGVDLSNAPLSDVWSSPDGSVWTRVQPNAPWGSRIGYACLVHEGKLWVMAGMSSTNSLLADIWSSVDGLNWTQVTGNAPWGPRVFAAAVSYGHEIWLLGGATSLSSLAGFTREVWNSPDGNNWRQNSDMPATLMSLGYFGASSTAVVLGSKIWVADGWRNEVWSAEGGGNDFDEDGLSNEDEATLGTDPADPDSDDDGMYDGWEVQFSFNPLVADSQGDADNDGLSNLEEFTRQTDPTNPADPIHEIYVDAVLGNDLTGNGTALLPFKTIGRAMEYTGNGGTSAYPFLIHIRPGTYAEKVILVPYVQLVGDDQATTIISHFNAADPEHVIVMAAEGTRVENLTIRFPGNPAVAVLVEVNDVATEIANVELNGSDNPFSIGIQISGANSSASRIHDSTVKRVEYGIRAVDSSVKIARNLFQDILGDAVFVRLPEGKQGESGETPQLGSTADAAETGFNRFRNVNGLLVQNANPAQTRAEYNDWGLYTDAEIQAKVSGEVDFKPYLGKALVLGSLSLNLVNGRTLELIPEDAGPVVQGTLNNVDWSPLAREPVSGVFYLDQLDEGTWTVSGSAEGYVAGSAPVYVSGGIINVAQLNLAPVAGPNATDIDGNAEVNAVDVQLVINAALGITIAFNADVDDSGSVDAVDVQKVINGALGIS